MEGDPAGRHFAVVTDMAGHGDRFVLRKATALPTELATARPQTLRLRVLCVAGRQAAGNASSPGGRPVLDEQGADRRARLAA